MDFDIGSNFTISEGLSALSRTVDTYYTASIDHKGGIPASYFVSCGTWATSFVATLQHSADGSTDWTDEADTTYKNTVSVTLTEAGSGQINCPNPRRRYTRVKVAVGGTNVFGVTNMKGPLDAIYPSS